MTYYLNDRNIKANMPDYFNSTDNKEADKRLGVAITKKIHNELNNLFSGIGFWEGTFSLQVKEGSCLYHAPKRRVAYALQKPLKVELDGYRSSTSLQS